MPRLLIPQCYYNAVTDKMTRVNHSLEYCMVINSCALILLKRSQGRAELVGNPARVRQNGYLGPKQRYESDEICGAKHQVITLLA